MNKKTYISPDCRVVLIETAMPLADTTLGVGEEDVDNGVRSIRYGEGSWEEDEDEE